MAMNRKDRRRARAMGTPVPAPEQERRIAIAAGPPTWSVRLFALFGALCYIFLIKGSSVADAQAQVKPCFVGFVIW